MRKNRSNVTREVKMMNTKNMSVDMAYQREIDERRIARMAKDYDPCLVNLVKISVRDGKNWIFDGRHTSVLEKTVRGNGEDVNVACLVYHGLTRLDEMELFVEQNGKNAQSPKIYEKMRSLYNFGDADITGMVSGARCAGAVIDFKNQAGPNRIVALSALLKVYLKLTREQYISMLNVIQSAWGGIQDGYRAEILNGMCAFYMTYYGKFDPNDLVKSLKRVLPIQIIREGKSVGTSVKASTFARIILRLYNTGRSTKRLSDELE